MKQKRRQHYVPQFYLRNFSLRKTQRGKKRVNTYFFDKTTEKSGLIAIKNIAQEKYFYGNKLEHEFGKIESSTGSVYKKIIDNKDITHLEFSKNRSLMSLFLSAQFLRTKFFRESSRNHLVSVKDKLLEEFGQVDDKLLNELNMMLNDESRKKFHLDFLNYPSFAQFAQYFLSKKWILLENLTKMPFLTSDNPIVLYNPFYLEPFGNLGLLSQGIQIYFPLSPELCLCLLDPKVYINYKKMKWIDPYYIGFNILKTEKYNAELMDVCFHNSLQIKQSFRQIYSKKNDFGLAEYMLKDNPQLKQTNNEMEVSILKGVNTPDGKKDIIHTKRKYY